MEWLLRYCGMIFFLVSVSLKLKINIPQDEKQFEFYSLFFIRNCPALIYAVESKQQY